MPHDAGDEVFDIVDEEGRVIGRASRADVHSNPRLVHQVVHVLVFDRRGDLLLQRRGRDKEIQPGKWDTSVGGHVAAGESLDRAVVRELYEELGIRDAGLEFLYDYLWRSPIETERVRTFRMVYEGPIVIPPEEIEAARFFSREEIEQRLGTGAFTPLFEHAWERYREWQRRER